MKKVEYKYIKHCGRDAIAAGDLANKVRGGSLQLQAKRNDEGRTESSLVICGHEKNKLII